MQNRQAGRQRGEYSRRPGRLPSRLPAAPARRRNVFEELNTRSFFRAQPGDVQTRAENLIEMLLLDAVIFALTRHAHSERVAIKRQALLRIAHDDGRVINAKKNRSAGLRPGVLPLRIAFARRKENDFQHMILRVAKIKRLDARRAFVPFRQRLRRGRDVLHLVREQPRVSRVHVAHDDRDVLKPAVVAARIRRDWSARVAGMLRERDAFVAEFQFRHAQFHMAQAEQRVLLLAAHVGNGNQFKRQRVREKIQFLRQVADGQIDRANLAHARLRGEREQHERHDNHRPRKFEDGRDAALERPVGAARRPYLKRVLGRIGFPPSRFWIWRELRQVNSRNPIRPDQSFHHHTEKNILLFHSRIGRGKNEILTPAQLRRENLLTHLSRLGSGERNLLEAKAREGRASVRERVKFHELTRIKRAVSPKENSPGQVRGERRPGIIDSKIFKPVGATEMQH